MKKYELVKYFDESLMDKLFGFCYARTNDSYEAGELCSDIIFALVKASGTVGEITSIYPFIWKVARNVYADFSKSRRKYADKFYEGNADEVLQYVADDTQDDNSNELLSSVYRRIAFLTKAYREVMIMYYLDGLSIAEIAKRQNASEVAIRQRLFSARQKIKSEVEKMTEIYNKPLALDKVDYIIWGTGNPEWGDPRELGTRMFSNHIIWLCHKKPMSAAEIAEELNVPTLYVEEELEFLTQGKNGEYGFLLRMANGKYAINFILLDKEIIEEAHALYTEQLPQICTIISDHIAKYKDEYLAFPYLNKKVDWNLILWQQIFPMSQAFSERVEDILAEKYFAEYEQTNRPFSIFGYVDNGKAYGGGWDGIVAQNVCGYSLVSMDNIYITRIKNHFHCGHNISNDAQIQLAIRAIDGLPISSLPETEKEHAAKAIECGYLYRENDMLYTKILVHGTENHRQLFNITGKLHNAFENECQIVAAKLAALIKKSIPTYLLGEWKLANKLANMPVLDSVVEALIEQEILIPPMDGIGAEGCWMSVMK